MVLILFVLNGSVMPTFCDPMDYSPPGSSVHGDSPGKNTEVGCHALLQGIFPTQGPHSSLLHCRWILYQLSYLLYLFIFGFAGSSLLGRLSLVVASGGCSLVVCRLLVAVASLVEEHGP